MSTKKNRHSNKFLFAAGVLLIGSVFYLACNSGTDKSKEAVKETELDTTVPVIKISPVVPIDILPKDSADSATLIQAAVFAWQEFIALNWPAEKGFRDSANAALAFGSQTGTVPLVWHTFRHKVEIYPGNNKPPTGYDSTLPYFGYNTPVPSYLYDPKSTGTADGSVLPCDTPSKNTPWVNLDETNEIGVATMFAGVADSAKYPGQQILFLAKANKQEYKYAAQRKWWDGKNGFPAAQKNTLDFININGNTPIPGNDSTYVSLPYGTIEIKTAWRRLTKAEKASGRFFSTTVRYYNVNGKTKKSCYTDEEFGMIALHIIHKTPTAPYFVFASFEQTDNILTTDGQAVEDEDGNVVRNKDLPPLTPHFKVTNATGTTYQKFNPDSVASKPGKSLYYRNTAGAGLPVGTVTINKRLHPIPQDVIKTNLAAHNAIKAYNKANNVTNSPWEYYKLVNVQYKPIQKAPGVNYTAADSANYYMANSVVESDYILQEFSGKFSPFKGKEFTITDYADTLKPDSIAYNAYNNGKYLMGGCMGCHGNATNKGTDYSFILGKPVKEPQSGDTVSLAAALKKQMLNFNR